MSFDEEYLALREKRLKKKKNNTTPKIITAPERKTTTSKTVTAPTVTTGKKRGSGLMSRMDELPSPVKTYTPPAPAATGKKSNERTWFKPSSYLADGSRDKGDITKAILGTFADVGTNAASGIVGMGETMLDSLAMLGTAAGNAQMSQLSNDELAFKALTGKSKNAESVVKRYDSWQNNVKKGTTEFVKADLYDEGKIAKKIIEAPFENQTGIDVEGGSVFGERADALAQSAGQLLATAGLSAAGMPWFLTTGATSFGAEAENALKEGATFEQAAMSGAVSAGAEILSEKLFGGIKFGGKTLDDVIIKPFLNKISHKTLKVLANVGIDTVGEGFEEVFSSVLSRVGTALYKEESIGELLTSEEACDEYIESLIAGMALGGTSSTVNAVTNRNSIELSENEQKVFDKVVEDRIAEETKDGKKLTKGEETKIRKAVLNDMLKGAIDTDTIESVLGGEDYKAYKEAEDNETAIQKEFDTLNKMKQGEMTGEQIDRRAELKQQLEELKSNSTVGGLKTKVSDNVSALVKDSRLSESYNEKARRRQSFEADLTKYNTKQQDTVKKAIESGILNNTRRTHDFVDMIAKISADKGVSFDFTSNDKLKESGFAIEGKTVNGLVTKDGIKINVNSAKALNSVVGHEITHILEGTELYSELQTMLKAVAESKGEYQTRYDEISKLYEDIEGADIEKELTADLIGDYLFTDSDFVNRLSTEKPGVFKKIFDEIKYLCRVAASGSKEAKELEKVKRVFEKAYKESVDVKNTADEGGVRYSVQYEKATVNNDIVSLVEKVKNKDYKDNDFVDLGIVSDKAVGKIKEILGVDVSGYKVVIEARQIKHILKGHGEQGRTDHSMANDVDIGKMEYVFQNFDSVVDGGRTEAYFEMKNGHNRTARTVLYEKEIGEKSYYVVQAVPETKRKTLFVVSTYIGKKGQKKKPLGSSMLNSPDATSTTVASVTSNDSIPNFTENVKRKQLEIIEKVNPAPNTYNTWIRKVEDIKTLAETLEDSDWADGEEFNPDLTRSMIEEAIESGEITVYSSYPIEQGVFVSPSYMEAASYSGDGNVYEKTVKIDEVAWIDPTQGMYANTAESYSLSSKNTAPKKYGDYAVYGEDVMLEGETKPTSKREFTAPTRESIAEKKKAEKDKLFPMLNDDIPVRKDVNPLKNEQVAEKETEEPVEATVIKTVEDRISAKIKNSQEELSNNQRLLEESNADFDSRIAEAQAEYDAKKNKNTKVANNILRRIETLKRRKNNIAADYSKRISDIEASITRKEGSLSRYREGLTKDQLSRLEKYHRRTERRLEADKKALEEEYAEKKASLQEEVKDKNAFISRRAKELYDEKRSMQKGVRVSRKLGYLLDLRKELDVDWEEFNSVIFRVSRHPNTVIDVDSEMEAAVRVELNNEFQDRTDELKQLDTKLAEEKHKLEEDADKAFEKFERANRRMTKQKELEEQMAELIGDTSTWKDKKYGLQYKVNTLRRNLRDIVRDSEGKRDIAKADSIYYELQGKYNHNEAELFREANKFKAKYEKMEITKAEDKYIQMLGELGQNPDTTLTVEAVEEYYEKHKKQINNDKVQKVIEEARKDYDDLLVRVNKVLKEHGMQEIPHRKGYFPHFTEEKQGFLGKLFNWKTQNDDIPTDIAGMTESFNPIRSWQSFNKQRTGDDTTYSFMKGFDTYVHGALDWIYHIEDLQKRRAFENHLRYIHSEAGIKEQIEAIKNNEEYDADTAQKQIEMVYANAKNPLNNFVTNFRTATNTLAGKKSSMDRGVEEATNRHIYSTMTNISNRVSGNLIAGSISSAFTNFIPITQSWGQVSPISTLKAMKETLASTYRDDGTINKSDFLTTRLRAPENLYKTAWDKIGSKVGWLMESIDSFTSQTVWRSKYIENIAEGMSENEAIKNADQFSANVMASRSRGDLPTVFDSKNPFTKVLTAFQVEVSNQYGYMFKDMPQDMAEKSKARLVKGYLTMFVGAYAYNALYSKFVGRDAAFDPIGIIEDVLQDLGVIGDNWLPVEILEALGLLDEDDEDEETDVSDVFDAIGNFGKNVAEEIPYVGGLLGGGRIPISSALPYDGHISELWDSTMGIASELNFEEGMPGFWASAKEAVKSNNFKNLTRELLNPVYYLAMPMGGGQLRKINQGLKMFFDKDLPIAGSYTDSGNLRFPVEKTPGNVLQAALFGQYANKNAQTYFDEGYEPLKEKQIQEFKDLDLPIADYWKIREGLSELKPEEGKTKVTLNQKGDYIGGLDLPISKKNILINNIADREKKINMADYDKFPSFEVFDFAKKNPELYKVLQKEGISVREYKEKHEKSTFMRTDDFSWAADNPGKASFGTVFKGGIKEYRGYTGKLYELKADKDSNGKTINGSSKKKKTEYIWSLPIDEGQKAILYRSLFDSKADKRKYNGYIINYLKSRNDISYEDKKTILTELDFKIDDKGRITWD